VPVRPPTPEDLNRIAARYGFGLGPDDVASYGTFAAGLLSSWEAVEELYARTAPQRPEDRSWHRPDDADNPLGAWYVRTEISAGTGGPLSGRTVAIKDNVMVAGVPMMNGSRTVEGFVPSRDATVVSRLLAAGATITGKAVCEDLCFSGASHTSRTGPVRNPWDRERTSGGSSSGSAALVVAGQVDAALGGDQGGSVRIPASYCGAVGHKPTHGLVPYTGAFPIESTIDHLGPITTTVADAALLLEVLAGADGLDHRQPQRSSATGTARPSTSRRRACGWACWRRGSPSPTCPAPRSTTPCGLPSSTSAGPGWPSATSRCPGTETGCTCGT
jgi:amidase